MGDSNPSILETRRDQVLPHLDTTDIERARRFGEVRRFALGDALAKVGEVGIGLAIILSGHVDVYRYEAHGVRQHFYTFGPGSFLGELAQLAGRPSFGDAVASELVEALVFSPDRMRALLIAEAELGERLMRALILRRTQMLQDGVGGPVIVGRSENPNVLRLEGFLARNGTPRMRLDPDNDPEAKALIDRFHVDPGQLPIVICPGGQVLRNPSEDELARCIGLVSGNSAGQAVVFLSEHVAKVWMLVRGADLASTMSRYLVDRVSGLANVQVLACTQITALEGTEGVLSAVQWHRGTTGERVRRPIRHLFLFIGADPNTGWLSGSGVALDPKRFALTGTEAGEHRRPLETSRRGVFAIGDIRSGSVKRVAAAVGEGAQVVATLHAHLSPRA